MAPFSVRTPFLNPAIDQICTRCDPVDLANFSMNRNVQKEPENSNSFLKELHVDFVFLKYIRENKYEQKEHIFLRQ